jgi:Uma2 family endonuclease
MGETPQHRDNLAHLIDELKLWYAADPNVYVSGNMFLYYVPGNRRKHVSPDVFVVKSIPRLPERRRYLLWVEGKGPDLVIELTSPSTRKEDVEKKFALYRDVLAVKEYFLFDPLAEYLDPPLQGYRLRQGGYRRMRPLKGRLPSQVIGLHLEANGDELRLYNPATGKWLPTVYEIEQARQEEAAARQQEAAARQQEATARQQAEAEVERLRQELEALRRLLPPRP